MKPYTTVPPASFVPATMDELLKQLLSTQKPVMLSVDGKVQAVVQDIASFQQTQEQLAMLRILLAGQQQIATGDVIDHESFFAELQAQDAEKTIAD